MYDRTSRRALTNYFSIQPRVYHVHDVNDFKIIKDKKEPNDCQIFRIFARNDRVGSDTILY